MRNSLKFACSLLAVLIIVLLFSSTALADVGVTYENFGVTENDYKTTDDWDQIVNDVFGPDYRVADWDDLFSYYESGGNLEYLFDGLGLSEYKDEAFVTKSGNRAYSSTRYYHVSWHNHNRPGDYLAHDNIDNYLISLGSWTTPKQIMAVKKTTSTRSDTTSPSISISSPINGQSFESETLTINGAASDDVALKKIEVKIGTGSWQTASGTEEWSKTLNLETGSNDIYVKATDTSGNTKKESITVDYNPSTSDTTLPSISISSPINGQFFESDTITINGAASDDVALKKIEVKIGTGSWQTASGTEEWSKTLNLETGSNDIYVKATDTSGNTKEESITIDYNPPSLDTTLPSISISSPINGQFFESDTITINGAASDDVALKKIEVKIGTGSWQTASGTEEWSKTLNLETGSNDIYVKATDTSGNTKEELITVDYNPPETVTSNLDHWLFWGLIFCGILYLKLDEEKKKSVSENWFFRAVITTVVLGIVVRWISKKFGL